jgi:fructose-1,6-bisphosphatase/sedoheptulose 1,7-bisphosphatase-like protein
MVLRTRGDVRAVVSLCVERVDVRVTVEAAGWVAPDTVAASTVVRCHGCSAGSCLCAELPGCLGLYGGLGG